MKRRLARRRLAVAAGATMLGLAAACEQDQPSTSTGLSFPEGGFMFDGSGSSFEGSVADSPVDEDAAALDDGALDPDADGARDARDDASDGSSGMTDPWIFQPEDERRLDLPLTSPEHALPVLLAAFAMT